MKTILLYNLDNEYAASKWVREEVKGVKTYDAPQITSGIKVCPIKKYGSLVDNTLGYFHNSGNNVYKNPTGVALFSGTCSVGHGLSVIEDNFYKVISLFTARKLIKKTWLNDTKEYIAPNTKHPLYEQWNNDCIVYSLFNTASNQSSLRDVLYNGGI